MPRLRTLFVTLIALAIATVPALAQPSLADLSDSFEDLTGRVTRGVVQIFATGYGTGPGLLVKQRGSGSGVILDSSGYIVTNAHVVAGARRVQVAVPVPDETLEGRTSILKNSVRIVGGQIVGVDRETDLAVVKVSVPDLPTLTLGDSDTVKQGQIVLAFGSPLGLENSVTMGVVSSTARQLETDAPVVYIQTDAPINPGNSGGPLVDADGNVIGINTLIFTQSGGSEGIGFAVPSNIVRAVYEQLRATGRVRRGEIGVHAQTITPAMATGLRLERTWGVLLGDVYPESPAAKAGLRIGDIVLSLDGKPMENARQFDVNVYRQPVGGEARIEYLREGETRTASVKVAERPDDPKRFEEMVTPDKNLVPRLGILVMEMGPRIAAMLPPQRLSDGVVVAAVSPEGPAWRDGFESGDIIYSMNGRPITGIENLRGMIEKTLPGDAVVVQIQRGRRLRYLAFDME